MAEGDFNEPTNWTGGALPAGGDTARVANDGTVWLTDSQTVGSLEVPKGSFSVLPGTALTVGGALTIGQQPMATGTVDLDNGQLLAFGPVTVGTAGGDGTFNFLNGFMLRAGPGSLVVGEGSGSTGDFIQLSGFLNCTTSFQVGTGAGATAVLECTGRAAANVNDWFILAADGASGTFKISESCSFNKLPAIPDTHVAIGRGNGSTAVVEQTGGLFTNVETDTYLGESGTATASWTLSGTGSTAVFTSLILGHADSASATFQQNGGTLNMHRAVKGESTGNTSIVFNGGTVTPRSNDPDFISGIDSVTVEDGGLTIDTTGPFAQPDYEIGFAIDLLDGGGGLTKRGGGSLTYEGTGYYTGATAVEGGLLYIDGELTESEVTTAESGTLGGTGIIAGSVTSYGAIAPGHGVGTLSVEGSVAVSGALAIELTALDSDVLAVAGDLNVEGATLSISLPDGAPLLEPYVIATYGTRSGGDFADIEGDVFHVYSVDYAYEGNQIAVTPALSPYGVWASGYEWENDGDNLPEADPDADGFANALEFFLDGDPLVPGPPSGTPKGTLSVEGDRFLFVFERNAGASATEPVIEYGTGLDFTSVATDGEDGVIITTEASPGGETWTVSFPMPPAGKLFARLKVEL